MLEDPETTLEVLWVFRVFCALRVFWTLWVLTLTWSFSLTLSVWVWVFLEVDGLEVDGLTGDTGLGCGGRADSLTSTEVKDEPWQISAKVLNLGPRSLRNSRSSSLSSMLKLPTEPAGEPWPS